jgi:hypothetical protein
MNDVTKPKPKKAVKKQPPTVVELPPKGSAAYKAMVLRGEIKE